MPEVPDRSIRICADRGGTFCDVFASYPDPERPGETKEIVVKLREFPMSILCFASFADPVVQYHRTKLTTGMLPQKAYAECWR